MCGISAIFKINSQNLSRVDKSLSVMNELQKHRGPDGEGKWIHHNGHLGLSHVRLSIIDLNTGRQPMLTESQNAITYNGEIYNYKEIRNQIGENNFKTQSDTEVLLLAYEKWGGFPLKT